MDFLFRDKVSKMYTAQVQVMLVVIVSPLRAEETVRLARTFKHVKTQSRDSGAKKKQQPSSPPPNGACDASVS